MGIHVLARQQCLPAPVRVVFDFFSKPENLAYITPPSLGFRILTPPPIKMEIGTLIEYEIHVLNLPFRWTTLITSYEPSYRFIDEQLKGPYKSWRHMHTFREVPGGTIVEDEVQYVLPLGLIGDLVHRTFVLRQLSNIFQYRSQVMGSLFREATVSDCAQDRGAVAGHPGGSRHK